MKVVVVLLLILSGGLVCFAQSTPPSFETVVEDVVFNTSSRVIIDEKTIQDSRAPNVTSLLATQANVTITNTPFQPNSIYIRGGDSSHVLILVDGVPFYDASTIQRTFNLNSLNIKSIRRIEIIKGSQTVLYGGQALSGVIKIDTIPQDFVTKTGLQAALGTQNKMDLSFVHTQALSPEDVVIARGHGSWKDAKSPVFSSTATYPRHSNSGDVTYAWKGSLEGSLKLSHIQERNYSATSGAGFQILDTNDFVQFSQQLGVSANLRLTEGAWSPQLSLSTQNSVREFDQPVGPTNPNLADQDYNATLRTARLWATPFKLDSLSFLTGLSYTFEDFVAKDLGVELANAFSEQRGLYAKLDYDIAQNFELSIGGRIENWDHQNAVSTYQAGLTLFEKTKLEISTGYKVPSLFQLYSSYGNPDLKEERASQYSLSQELDLSPTQGLSMTVYTSQFSNLITTVPVAGGLRYANVNKVEARGVELTYRFLSSSTSSVVATYGYQEAKDIGSGRWLTRRPMVNGSLRYSQNWGAHAGVFELLGAGEKLDRTGTSTYSFLPGYLVANATYNYTLSEQASFYARLDNLLDHRYQETFSFYTEGLTAQLGAEYWF